MLSDDLVFILNYMIPIFDMFICMLTLQSLNYQSNVFTNRIKQGSLKSFMSWLQNNELIKMFSCQDALSWIHYTCYLFPTLVPNCFLILPNSVYIYFHLCSNLTLNILYKKGEKICFFLNNQPRYFFISALHCQKGNLLCKTFIRVLPKDKELKQTSPNHLE